MKIIDLHCDTILKLIKSSDDIGLYKNDCSVDIEKLIKANSIAQFFALFVDLKDNVNAFEMCMKMCDRFYMELDKNRKYINLATNYSELIKNDSEGKISAFLTVEEGGVIEDNLYNLRNLYRLGVRLITLTWNYPNKIGYPNIDENFSNKGLTYFGKEVIAEMHRLGMIIDVSHLSDAGFNDVAALSSKPFTASHSNSREVQNHKRNLTDSMIKVLAEKGGVMGINYEKTFLGDSDISRVEDMVKHISHIKNVGGIEVIALGSDFDGISPDCQINNIGEVNKLFYCLQKHGFSQVEIEKISHLNSLRLIKDVL